MNKQKGTKETKARQNENTAESVENISAMKQNQNKWRSRHLVSGSLEKVASPDPRIVRVASSEELGIMSKNNLSGITLVRGPIWGIRSLTLIIS